MKRRVIAILARESLLSMPTKQLLVRLRSLQCCEESAAVSDSAPGDGAAGQGILFKNTPEWRRAHAELKALLATREHVPSAAERAAARHRRAVKKSNKRAGADGGTALLQRAPRQRPAAPHHGRYAALDP